MSPATQVRDIASKISEVREGICEAIASCERAKRLSGQSRDMSWAYRNADRCYDANETGTP